MASACQRLYPDPVPGGSLISSVDSRFQAAAYTLYQTSGPGKTHASIYSHPTTHASLTSSLPSETSRVECPVDPLTGVIQHLSRSKVEALVTQAWIRNIPNQPEDKLRDLVIGAVSKGILNRDDIQSTFTNTFSGLPTNVQLQILSYLSIRQQIVFLTSINSEFIRLAHQPTLWKHLDLRMPYQPTLSPLSTFLTKYTPAKAVESLSFTSTTKNIEFLKFLVTLKRLRSRLRYIEISGKEVTRTNLSAMESLLGKWTRAIILTNPSSKVGVSHITSLISAAPRLQKLAVQTNTMFFGQEYTVFLKELLRAGESTRVHHVNPEVNSYLRVLHISASTSQSVRFGVLADLGKFFPLLEMLRIENWKIVGDTNEYITPIATLRGLSLVELDMELKRQTFAKLLSGYVANFPALEILFVGARETDMLGWKLFVMKRKLGKLFADLNLPKLKVLWLRAWIVDCEDLISLKADNLKFLVVEECKGMNGGWIKAANRKWKGLTIVETDYQLKEGFDFVARSVKRMDV